MNRIRLFFSRTYHKKIKIKNQVPIDFEADLRSDTFTMPCLAMRNAMNSALLGDDVWEEDPTVQALEKKMAEITGKESALFVASGTMGNLLSVLSHCGRRGAEVLLGDKSHIFHTEQANIVQFGGVQPHPVPTLEDGTLCMDDLVNRIRSDDFHYPSTELLCFENTHGQLGGKVLPLAGIDQIASFAEEHVLPLHVDGARIFNASVSSGIKVSRLLKGVTSASICLSKGLGAPVGSVIVGPQSFVERARRLRKGLGGGWRQAGVIAAGGLYAIEHNVERLKQDHDNARIIAEGIVVLDSPHLSVDLEHVQTNMILLKVNPKSISVEDFCRKLMEVTENEGNEVGKTTSVLVCPYGPGTVRLVTHLSVSEEASRATVEKISYICRQLN